MAVLRYRGNRARQHLHWSLGRRGGLQGGKSNLSAVHPTRMAVEDLRTLLSVKWHSDIERSLGETHRSCTSFSRKVERFLPIYPWVASGRSSLSLTLAFQKTLAKSRNRNTHPHGALNPEFITSSDIAPQPDFDTSIESLAQSEDLGRREVGVRERTVGDRCPTL